MGYDLYGNAGGYFRASVWNWHPIVDYIEANYPDIAARCENWRINGPLDEEGRYAGLGEDDCLALAERLSRDLATGAVARAAERPQDTRPVEFMQSIMALAGPGVGSQTEPALLEVKVAQFVDFLETCRGFSIH